jgi:decaprenyl-phosphate phosphoribosyltransferase
VVLVDLFRLTRPRQWLKNVLVAAVPLAAGRIHETEVLVPTLYAMVMFVVLSASVYVVNDLVDRDRDRTHPDKRHRPVASGNVSPAMAVILATGLLVVAAALAIFLIPGMATIALAYLLLQIAYQSGLKRVALIDVAVVAAGFVLRAVAGGAAAELPVSPWFMTVTASAALFVVSMKRYSEVVQLGTSGGTREVLMKYSESQLRTVWTTALTSSIVFYALWATEISEGSSLALLTTVPFSLALIRYSSFAQSDMAQAPERIVLSDPMMLILGLAWLILFVLRSAI